MIPEGHDVRADAVPADQLVQGLRKLHAEIEAEVARMPDHRAHLESYCPMREAA